MRSSTSPVVGTRSCQACITTDFGRDQHSFIAGKDGLTECYHSTSIVDDTDVVRRILTIWLVWEGFLDGSAVVTEESTVLRMSAGVHNKMVITYH